MTSIEAINISKNFGSVHALKDVDLEISDGCTVILGPNGSGKTTFMKILTRMMRPSSGLVKIDGEPLEENFVKSLGMIGSLVEQPEFYTYLTGREIMEFVCRIRNIPKNSVNDEIKRVSDLCGISSYSNRKSGTYSRGMKQRLGLAVSMISSPDILILDEPTFGLDPRGIVEMRNIIKNYSREEGKIVLLSTHMINEAVELSNRILILYMGVIRYDSMNGDDKRVIRVTFDEPFYGKIEEPFIQTRSTGNEALIEIPSEKKNWELIYSLVRSGARIREVEENYGIEDVYMNIVSD